MERDQLVGKKKQLEGKAQEKLGDIKEQLRDGKDAADNKADELRDLVRDEDDEEPDA